MYALLQFESPLLEDFRKSWIIPSVTAAISTTCCFEQKDVSRRNRDRVREMMKGLPPDQMQILAKVYMEGKSHAEAAAELDLPLGTVKSRVRLAIQKLQIQIDN